MRKIDRFYFVARDDKAHAKLRGWPQPLRKIVRGADTAVRGRMTGQHAFMQCHARPGDALHEGHGRATVEVRMMVAVLLDNAEHASRSRMAWHTSGNWALGNPHPIAVKRHFLGRDVDRNLQRTFRHIAETNILFWLAALRPSGRCRAVAAGVMGIIVAVPTPLREIAQSSRVGIRRARQPHYERDCDRRNERRTQAEDSCTTSSGKCVTKFPENAFHCCAPLS